MAITIREIDRKADRRGVEQIDTSFVTPTIFEMRMTARSIELVETPLPTPLTKRYPIADAFAPWSTWDTGWVAEADGKIVAVAAVEYEAWHRRLVLWHLYVTTSHRRTGVGRALLERCEVYGRSQRARRVWLETSNVNVPGIAAYERLGYALCGSDATLYDGLPYERESAVYLSKLLQ